MSSIRHKLEGLPPLVGNRVSWVSWTVRNSQSQVSRWSLSLGSQGRRETARWDDMNLNRKSRNTENSGVPVFCRRSGGRQWRCNVLPSSLFVLPRYGVSPFGFKSPKRNYRPKHNIPVRTDVPSISSLVKMDPCNGEVNLKELFFPLLRL